MYRSCPTCLPQVTHDISDDMPSFLTYSREDILSHLTGVAPLNLLKRGWHRRACTKRGPVRGSGFARNVALRCPVWHWCAECFARSLRRRYPLFRPVADLRSVALARLLSHLRLAALVREVAGSDLFQRR